MRVIRIVMTASVVVATLLAAPPAHAIHIAAGEDARGDATDPTPGRDIAFAAVGYEREAGTIRGGIMLHDAPAAGSGAFVAVLAGKTTPTGCDGFPQVILASFTNDTLARWTRFDGLGPPTAEGDADRNESGGKIQKFEVTDAALRGYDFDCLHATVRDLADPNRVYDDVGPFPFEPLPELEARLSRTTATLEPGRTRSLRLRLRNPGDASTGPVRLSVAGRRGLTARVTKRVEALAPGRRRTVSIKVSLSARAKRSTPLRVTVRAGELRVRAKATLYLREPPRGGGGGSGDGSGVCAGYAPVFGGVGSVVAYPC